MLLQKLRPIPLPMFHPQLLRVSIQHAHVALRGLQHHHLQISAADQTICLKCQAL